MMKTEKKKDVIFLVVQILVAAAGAAVIIYKDNMVVLWAYFVAVTFGILFIYFYYSICRWRNLWNNLEYRHAPKSREPSDIVLAWVKVVGWFFYIIGLVLALLPASIA